MNNEETNRVGTQGQSFNASTAGRAPHVTPDPERVARYDPYPVKAKKEAWKQFGLFLLFAVGENPLRIAVMAPMQTMDDVPTCWGAKCFEANELPGMKVDVGERVPCAVMFGGAMSITPKKWLISTKSSPC